MWYIYTYIPIPCIQAFFIFFSPPEYQSKQCISSPGNFQKPWDIVSVDLSKSQVNNMSIVAKCNLQYSPIYSLFKVKIQYIILSAVMNIIY